MSPEQQLHRRNRLRAAHRGRGVGSYGSRPAGRNAQTRTVGEFQEEMGLAIVAATFNDLEALPLEWVPLSGDSGLFVGIVSYRMGSG